ncbi:MAG: hypothetical protein JWO75_6096, partial [Actinomycetia bacterium]|nr:hypothetical protein [Actinomycetes bacterium]
MQELRFVAVSEDGSYAVLAVPGRSGRYILPIDERLRAVAQGQTSRLAQYEIEVESPLRPKEIQARIRAGETAEEIADAAGIPVERVRWFEGPVLAERAYIADQAQAGSVRRAGDSSGPGPRLGEIVTARLSAAGTDPADGQWDSRKRGDGNWQVSLTFPSGGRLHVAEWVFDPRRRHVMPDDDNAARLSLPESELPAEPVPVPGEATVTPIASRLGAAAGMGGGSVGGSGVSRFRPDRSVIPDRSLGADRSLVDPPVPPSAPVPERTAMSDRSALSDRYAAPEQPSAPPPPVPPRSAQQDRPPHQNRPASYDYVEFPESAPYRVPEPAPEQPAQRDQPREPARDRAQAAEPPAYREAAPEPRTYRDPAPEAAYRAPATQQPAFRDQAPESAAYGAPAADVPAAAQVPAAAHVPAGQVSAAPAVEDSERVRPAPPRPVIFEDPEPAFPGDQPELPQDLATAQPAPATAPRAAEPAHAAQEPAAPSPASRPEPRAAAVAAPSAASATSVTRAPAAATEVTAAAEPAVAAQPGIREPEPVAAQVRSSTDTVTPREAEAAAEPSAAAEPVTTAVSAAPGAAEPPATSEPAAPATSEPPARPEPKADVPAPA